MNNPNEDSAFMPTITPGYKNDVFTRNSAHPALDVGCPACYKCEIVRYL